MIKDLFDYLMNSGSSEVTASFDIGYLTGIAVFIVLLTIIKILHYFIFAKQKKIKEVRVPGEGGDLFISSNAISNMAKFVGKDIEGIEIVKIAIKKRKNNLVMVIIISYDLHSEALPLLTNKLRANIKNTLETQLGIDSIKLIDIHSDK